MQSRNKSPKRYLLLVSLALLFLLSSFASWIYLRYQSIDTVIEPTLQQIAINIPDAKPLAWPGYGQAAVGTKDYGILATHGDTEPQPTASTAKLITMLAIMTKSHSPTGRARRSRLPTMMLLSTMITSPATEPLRQSPPTYSGRNTKRFNQYRLTLPITSVIVSLSGPLDH